MGDPYSIEAMLGLEADVSPTGFLEPGEIAERFRRIAVEFPNLQSITMLSRDTGGKGRPALRGIHWEGEAYVGPEVSTEGSVERIGSGDAFMAGLLAGLANDRDREKILSDAAKLASFKQSIKGDALLIRPGEWEEIVSGTGGKELRR